MLRYEVAAGDEVAVSERGKIREQHESGTVTNNCFKIPNGSFDKRLIYRKAIFNLDYAAVVLKYRIEIKAILQTPLK